MKPILIDDLINDVSNQSGVSVTIDGVTYNGYQIAKPLNYEPQFVSMSDRRDMVRAILEGTAIAVRYFIDLSEEEQIDYVKNKLK